MHASIIKSQDIGQVLQYHAQKVRQGAAELIGGGNFIKNSEDLSLTELQYHFDRLNVRNDRMYKKVFHPVIHFDQHENIDNQTMALVAHDYLNGMKFGDQPWLAYRHYDSLIPHVHLISSNVLENGKKLNLSLKDWYHSRDLTHELEEKYSLHSAQRERAYEERVSQQPEKLIYGHQPLYTSMNNILEAVVPNYAYTSLDELNAVLAGYNLFALRGPEGSARYQNGGLLYVPVQNGKPNSDLGIKSSDFPSKPTVKNLEERFIANEPRRESSRAHLATAIDWCLFGTPLSLGAFKEAMEFEGIGVVCRHSSDGALQNCWFVDHNSRAVFEGSALGENYGAQALATRCIPEETYRQQQAETQNQTHRHSLHL